MAAKLEPIPEAVLRTVSDFKSFREFLRTQLRWPVPGGDELAVEDLTYSYLSTDLQLKPETSDRLGVRQLIPLQSGQPWGIFLLEFSTPKFYRTLVRQVLRALAPRRQRDSRLPAWDHESLLFICTHDYRQFTFAHFSGEKPTGARLTTFTLDPEAPKWRTLCEYNLPALRWVAEDGQPPEPEAWLKQWKQAFDKEALTNRFFRVFREQFGKLAEDIRNNNPNLTLEEPDTEAQIILERILFLYFLQRKGWLNKQRDYFHAHFREFYEKKSEGTDFFSKFLVPVFQQLSMQSEHFTSTVGTLPFLNGGLFEDDPIAYSREALKRQSLKISNAVFRDIFDDLLEPFNFTVREDTPLNQDVAVDPEMLGKILESLVLEMEEAGDAYAPDRRKATGSYYTPRIVVHFICREVLRQYLLARVEGPNWRERLERLLNIDATDGLDAGEFSTLRESLTQEEAERIRALLEDLKACDPAVGSGAFAVGLLHELVNLWTLCEARERNKDPREDRNYLFQVKKRFIENTIYGVDVLERAVEICKLRLWLSLIVDYELPVDPFECTPAQFAQALKKLPPLPNLAFKIRRGDSLLDQVHGHEILLEQFVRREGKGSGEGQRLVEEIVKLKTRFFEERNLQEKRRTQIQILERQWELAERFISQQMDDLPGIQTGLFGETEKEAEKRRWREEQEKRLKEALEEIERLRERLENISGRKTIGDMEARRLAELEGQVGKDVSFVWHLDFAEVFNRKSQTVATLRGKFAFMEHGPGQMELPEKRPTPSGFDIVVGNPPFVTARDPERREAYRERWQQVCFKTFQLVAPFFARSFGLLSASGELGFIVSNAFAKREFGRPLVQKFFPLVTLRKVVDCSGLMFPGHGTPTCIVFGSTLRPESQSSVRVAAILPGGGDLRTPPEDSPLWYTLARNHDNPGFVDARVVVSDLPRKDMERWPWRFDARSQPSMEAMESSARPLAAFVASMGSMFDTHKDDIFMLADDAARRCKIAAADMIPFAIGDQIRNWHLSGMELVLKPYDEKWQLRKGDKASPLFQYLRLFRRELGSRSIFGGGTYDDAGQPWYRYHQMSVPKITAPLTIVYPEIATHSHFLVQRRGLLFTQTAPLVLLKTDRLDDNLLCSSVLNSSAVLFWLKQVCFNKGAGEDEERDRFEFAGGKVEQLPVPKAIAEALEGKSNRLAEKLTELSRACWERGQQMPGLALRKLFEKPGEAYHDWNSSLPGYVVPNPALGTPFDSTQALRERVAKAQQIREQLRGEMIALQEEMDWLVYAAYGLLPEDHPAVAPTFRSANPDAGLKPGATLEPLEREQRSFRLWAAAEGNFDRAVKLIPCDWPDWRKKLWEARLATIRDNEHIRRIEQPVYKRRWDEQWKWGNQWRCGPVAYAAEFIDAFEWWLCEKAEWWLEHKKDGGPVELDDWALAMWKDSRIQAAWAVAAENYAFLEFEKAREKAEESGEPAPPPTPFASDFASFKKTFKGITDKETVPEGIPWAVPYEDLDKKKVKVPAKVKSVRGKLNVPRERFHLRGRSVYVWAGLQFD
jgi:hypothetical protein